MNKDHTLQNLLYHLHPQQQQIIQLILIEGYSYTEASKALYLPPRSIKTYLRSATLKVKIAPS